MGWLKYHNRVRSTLRQGIKKWFDDCLHDFPQGFGDSVCNFVLNGKLLRGTLVIFSHAMTGGKRDNRVLSLAVATELTHTGLLIHDDIMDQDKLRRGLPTLHQTMGQSLAVCVGDLVFYEAIKLIKDIRLVNLLTEQICQTINGQMLDVYYGESNREPDVSTIMDIYLKKTARYTFSLPLMLGALLNNIDEVNWKRLSQLGENLGLIFQLKDDELGVFGDEKTTGKPTGSDIRENKKTLMRLLLYQSSSDKEKKELNKIFGSKTITQKEINLIKKQLEVKKIIAAIDQKKSCLALKASIIIDKLPYSRQYLKMLQELLEYNLSREK